MDEELGGGEAMRLHKARMAVQLQADAARPWGYKHATLDAPVGTCGMSVLALAAWRLESCGQPGHFSKNCSLNKAQK